MSDKRWRKFSIMNIKIYGHPYHIYEQCFLNEDNIKELYIKYGNDIHNYIDGAFSIIIDDTVITDYYGYYPLFYNTQNTRIYDNITFNDNESKELNLKYKEYIYNQSQHNLDHSILLSAKKNLFNNRLAFETPFKYFRIIPPRCIKTENENTIIYKSDLIKIDNYYEYYDTLLTNLIKSSNKKNIVSPITRGYDCRNIYYHLKQHGYTNTIFYNYWPENEYISIEFNGSNIHVYDKIYDNLDFIDWFNDKIDILNGMSDLYYYHAKLQPIYDYLNEDVLYINSDGANEYLSNEDKYYTALIENSSHSHVTKLYSRKSTYLPIFANKVLTHNITDRKQFMSGLSKYYGYNPNYYTGLTNTRAYHKLFTNLNYDTLRNYYNKYIDKISSGVL